MEIAELFVSLGITGAEKVSSSLVTVQSGLQQVGTTSLEVKASLLAAAYALEQLFSTSNQAGQNLQNFGTILGEDSIQALQKYQYAARRVGVSNDETAATFKNLSAVATKIATGGGLPEGYGYLAKLTGNITGEDVKKYMAHPEELLKRLQDYAQKEKNVGIRNKVLSSFGLGDNLKAAVTKGVFNEGNFKRAPVYTDKEVASLSKASVAWSDLSTKIQMAVGHLNAAHGGALVRDFSALATAVFKVTDAFLKLTEKTHIFQGIDKTFVVMEQGAEAVANVIRDLGGELEEAGSKAKIFETLSYAFDSIKADGMEVVKFLSTLGGEIKGAAKDSGTFEKLGGVFSNIVQGVQNTTAEVGHLVSIAKELHVFDALLFTIDKIVLGLQAITGAISVISGAQAGGVAAIDKALSSKQGTGISDLFSKFFSGAAAGAEASFANINLGATSAGIVPNKQTAAPIMPASSSIASTNNNHVTVNQTNNFPGGTAMTAKEIKEHTTKAIQDAHRKTNQNALRQMPSQIQGS